LLGRDEGAEYSHLAIFDITLFLRLYERFPSFLGLRDLLESFGFLVAALLLFVGLAFSSICGAFFLLLLEKIRLVKIRQDVEEGERGCNVVRLMIWKMVE
jgi:hypothetical protein